VTVQTSIAPPHPRGVIAYLWALIVVFIRNTASSTELLVKVTRSTGRVSALIIGQVRNSAFAALASDAVPPYKSEAH